MTAGYAARARYYAAETSGVPQPELLAGLLRPGLRVAEMPSGTGHFLPAYTAAGADATLVDSCPQMLAEARGRAVRDGENPGTLCTAIEDLSPRHGRYGLIVMPNAALNQLAAGTGAAALLGTVARVLEPGGTFLAQVLDRHHACGFHDPRLADGTWHTDRQFTDDAGHQMTRRRRQRHCDDRVEIDFELHRGSGLAQRQHVTLRPLSERDLRAALAAAGLTASRIVPGAGGLTEVLARRPGGTRR